MSEAFDVASAGDGPVMDEPANMEGDENPTAQPIIEDSVPPLVQEPPSQVPPAPAPEAASNEGEANTDEVPHS